MLSARFLVIISVRNQIRKALNGQRLLTYPYLPYVTTRNSTQYLPTSFPRPISKSISIPRTQRRNSTKYFHSFQNLSTTTQRRNSIHTFPLSLSAFFLSTRRSIDALHPTTYTRNTQSTCLVHLIIISTLSPPPTPPI